MTVSIIGKTVTDKESPIFEFNETTAKSTLAIIDTIATPTPTISPLAADLYESTDIANNYWGELIEAEDPIAIEHVPVHGLYLNSAVNLAGNIELANNSMIDSFVIDLKEEEGVYFNSSNEFAQSLGYVLNSYNLEDVFMKITKEE